MKTIRIYLLFLFASLNLIGYSQINDKLKINLPADQLIEKSKDINEYHQIQWNTDYKTQEPGNPELPVYRVTYVLPIDVKVSDVPFYERIK